MMAMNLTINRKPVGLGWPPYFIADIASNHCGDLSKAKELIFAAAEAGASAAKFQNFAAETLVSDYGFKHLAVKAAHQEKWNKSVYESYKEAALPVEWTVTLAETCAQAGIDYFTSPYSVDLMEAVLPYLVAVKVGSGDVTWHDFIRFICRKGLPVILATGASAMEDVRLVMSVARQETSQLGLLQCNTNYTAKPGESRVEALERFRNINLRVLETYAAEFPEVALGLSDHTHGNTTVVGAVGLFGARIIEKHFTFDNTVAGQDHSFSMTPKTWREMIEACRTVLEGLQGVTDPQCRYAITAGCVDDPEALALAMGDGIKRVEPNERETLIVQRRSIRARRNLCAGEVIAEADLCYLRPSPVDALPPYRASEVVGRSLDRDVPAGDCVRLIDMKS